MSTTITISDSEKKVIINAYRKLLRSIKSKATVEDKKKYTFIL